ncbi:hypothetical protein [Spectribacter hydrogenoxidans]|uniref:Phage infection protein n=1 Tax=Spectribacter hydrogenoxidans TaxID=3075608 RepID=A0ABU3BY04_9GAMM|nr:hypothetical protein [Salinisphaera sp. W335]MDT0634197.1 hypothetical protein [Salinisphaera sp. W335]
MKPLLAFLAGAAIAGTTTLATAKDPIFQEADDRPRSGSESAERDRRPDGVVGEQTQRQERRVNDRLNRETDKAVDGLLDGLFD